MSRDGFAGFRQGITDADPSIAHVYDRWHWIRNAKKRLDVLLLSLVPAVIKQGDQHPADHHIEMTKAEERKKQRQEQKWAVIQEIQKAHLSGKTISQLAREYQLNWRTVKKYLQMTDPPPVQRRKRNPPFLRF